MTFYRWKTAINGDWSSPTDWDQGAAPNSSAAGVILGLTGSYAVTIASSDPVLTVDSVTITNPVATLDLAGALNLAGGGQLIAVEAGTFATSGLLTGATLVPRHSDFDSLPTRG